MIADTWLLLSLRWQIVWNGIRRRKLLYNILYGVLALWIAFSVGGLAAGLGFGAGALVLAFPQSNLAPLLPGAILTAVVLLLLLSSFGVALGSLFLANDLDLLMTAPVDRRAVFISKLLDGIAPNYAILAITALPALFTYGATLGYGVGYFLLMLITLIGVPLLPIGLGALLVMLVARLAPARRVREVLGLAGVLFGVTCGLLGQTSRIWISRFTGANARPEALLNSLRGIESWPIPTLMAGRALAAAGVGDWSLVFVGLGGFLLITFGFFALCVWAADALYAAGWVRMQSSGSAKRGRQRAERAAASAGLLGKASAPLAVLLKDWRVIPRDLRNFAQILSPLVLLPTVYIYILGGGRSGRNPLENVGGARGFDLTGPFIVAGILFATVLVFGRVAETAISMEGKSWWLLKVAPISAGELLRGKFMSAAVPYAVLSSLLVIGAEVWKHFNLLWFIYGWLGLEVLGAGMLALAVGLAVPWAKLDWDDPRRMSSWQTVIFSVIGWAVMGLFGGGLLCLPLLAELTNPELVAPLAVVGFVIASAITTGFAYLALQLGISRMPEVGESAS